MTDKKIDVTEEHNETARRWLFQNGLERARSAWANDRDAASLAQLLAERDAAAAQRADHPSSSSSSTRILKLSFQEGLQRIKTAIEHGASHFAIGVLSPEEQRDLRTPARYMLAVGARGGEIRIKTGGTVVFAGLTREHVRELHDTCVDLLDGDVRADEVAQAYQRGRMDVMRELHPLIVREQIRRWKEEAPHRWQIDLANDLSFLRAGTYVEGDVTTELWTGLSLQTGSPFRFGLVLQAGVWTLNSEEPVLGPGSSEPAGHAALVAVGEQLAVARQERYADDLLKDGTSGSAAP